MLYLQARFTADAETLLRQAVALGDPGDVPLRALHQLLVDQGKTEQAQRLEARLQARQATDPYFWIAQGVQYLKSGEYRRAIRVLEQARDMTSHFSEVHRLLAVAYGWAGERARADEELALLASAGEGEAASKLRRKIKAPRP
jgi:predicted Zn-dependent protease